jgi:hypothetical protein
MNSKYGWDHFQNVYVVVFTTWTFMFIEDKGMLTFRMPAGIDCLTVLASPHLRGGGGGLFRLHFWDWGLCKMDSVALSDRGIRLWINRGDG